MARLRERWQPLVALGAVCYIPLILTQPGWVNADTKTYLYLDPARLLSRAWSMWDPHVGLGTVSHQSIGYLWPMGPWYWAFERLGVPDWLAQRLWWATVLFAAGAGVVYLLRRFSWPVEAIWAAAFVYALSPYVLTLMGRLSAVLLPFAGLPWLLGLTVQAVRQKGWRHPALFALVVTTVGSINLTALVLVGVVPIMWLVHAALISREAPVRRVVGAAFRIGLLTVPVSLWWLSGLTVQASNGINVVQYTETAEVVASASSAQEVLRGLGYWFFYGGDRLDLWVEPSRMYTQQLWLLAVTFSIPLLALVGAATARWRHRAFFVALVLAGLLMAVGAHPWDSPPPLGQAVKAFLGSERGLAFRSLPRAAPVLALGLAVLLGAGVAMLAQRRGRSAKRAGAAVALLAVLALPPLWQGSLVAHNMRRQDIPSYWEEAAQAIDAHGSSTRVLEVPGSDFAAYRWGMTVDPITPGLIDRPYVARELIPYGSAASADLLNAFDLRIQERTLDPRALGPVARLLRAGDVVLRADLQYERYNTARPRLVWELLRTAPGLGAAAPFGPTDPNEPVAERQLRDQAWFVDEAGLPHPPAVAVVPVEGPVPIVATKSAAGAIVLSGDGAGIVDAAAAGLIDGTELILYSAALDEEGLRAGLDAGASILVTDTNRKRGERWSSVRHTRGYTETADHEPLVEDLTDNRLPVFPDAPASARTVAQHRGGITANATTYGNPIALAGEERPAAAVDGDPRTAWQTGNFSDARGERLRLELDEPTSTDRMRLLQPVDGDSNRTLTQVDVSLDGGPPIRVDLDDTSRSEPGQLVTFAEQTFSTVEIELVADSAGDRPRFAGVGPVGLAEVRIGDADGPVLDEMIQLPTDVFDRAGGSLAGRPVTYLLTRVRQAPTDETRDDEEMSIVRVLEVPRRAPAVVSGTARLSARASGSVLDSILGQSSEALRVTASSTLTGSLAHRAAAALDGDPATAWAPDLDDAIGSSLVVETAAPTSFGHLDLQVVADGRHSVPTALDVLVDGQVIANLTVDPMEDSSSEGSVTSVPLDFPATTGTSLEVRIAEVRPITSNSWDSGDPVLHPVGIAEIGLPGARLPAPMDTIDTGCRDDLLTIDDEPVAIRLTGSTAAALSGGRLDVTACDPLELGAGDHDLRAVAGRDTGLDLDQIVLDIGGSDTTEGGAGRADADGPQVEVLQDEPDHIRLSVEGSTSDQPSWLVLGQSHNDGWTATIDGEDLGPPVLVDGFANGWRLPDGIDGAVVDLRFEPQKRVDLALAVSALSAVACVILALRRPRGSATALAPHHDLPRPWSRSDVLGYEGVLPTRRTAGLTGIAVTLVSVLVVHPVLALVLGAAAAAGCRHERARRVIVLLPALLVAAIAAYVILWQVRHHIAPGLEWPGELSRAHPVAVFAVLALAVDVVVDRLWWRRPR